MLVNLRSGVFVVTVYIKSSAQSHNVCSDIDDDVHDDIHLTNCNMILD